MSRNKWIGIGALSLAGLSTWLTPHIMYIIYLLAGLVILDIIMNVGDEQKEIQAVTRLIMAAILPIGLQFIGSNGGQAHQYLLLGLALSTGVLLNRVVPQLLSNIKIIVGKIFPASEAAVIDNELQIFLQHENATLQARINELEKQQQDKIAPAVSSSVSISPPPNTTITNQPNNSGEVPL